MLRGVRADLAQVEANRDLMFRRMDYSVWVILVVYVFFYGYLEAWVACATVALGALVLSPLALYLHGRENTKTKAKILFVISCGFYIYTCGLSLKHQISAEYYYIPASMIPFLIFDLKRNKIEVIVCVAYLFFLWVLTVSVGVDFFPSSFFTAADPPLRIMRYANFIGSFTISIVFLNVFISTIAQLSGALVKRELHETKILRQAQRIANIGSWSFDVVHQKISWTEQTFEIFGLNPLRGEPAFQELAEMIYPVDRERWIHSVERAINLGEPHILECRIQSANGKVKTISIIGEPEKDLLGNVVRVRGTCQDVSSLRQQERLFETVVENTPNMICLKEAEGLNYKLLNRGGEELLGVKRREWLGKNDFDFLSRDKAEARKAEDLQVLKEKKTKIIFEEIFDAFSGKHYLRTRKVPILNEKGDPLFLLSVSEDITQVKEQEERLELVRKKTRQQEQDLGALFQASRNEIYLFNAETFCFQLVNASAQENLGYTMEELKRMTPWDLKPEYNQEKFKTTVAPLLSGEIDQIQFKTPHRRKDGSTYLAGVHLQLGEFEGRPSFFAFILDLSETEQLEKQLFHSARLSSIGELAAGVGHEINNPLAIASGNLQLVTRFLEEKGAVDGRILSLLEKQKVAHTRIRKIVDGLRTYARSDADADKVFSLNEAVEATVSMMYEVAHFGQIDFEQKLDAAEPSIFGSEGKVQQVVLNLLSNAKDATAEQEERKIKVETKVIDSGRAQISVSDNGTGISRELQTKIFDPFFTTKDVGEGTGLGLGIVRKIVESMNGTIRVISEEGNGTTFIVDFPISEERREGSRSQEERPELPPIPQGLKVLVVDDESELQKIMRGILEGVGCEVEVAETGVEALKLIFEKEFDVVYTDMKMPRMDGPSLLEEVHLLNLAKRPRLIAVTGGIEFDFSSEGREKLSSLIDGYILKPFDDYTVLAALIPDDESDAA